MDFEWTTHQKEFQNQLAAFAAEQLVDDVRRRDAASEFSEELWQRCATFGIPGMNVPVAYGGTQQADILTAVAAMETLGKTCRDMGLMLALNAQMWSVQLPIQRLGTDHQKTLYLPQLCCGKWKGAHAMTEPDAGSDAFGIRTTATKTADGYLLNGTKCMVTLAPLADVFLITASTDPAKGKWGINTFLVERSREGLRTGPTDPKMGLRTVPFGEVHLHDCFIPDHNLLGEGRGEVAALQSLLEVERCCILACQIGAMERQLEDSVKYVRSRRQFGRTIGSFQAVSHRIADMKTRLETSRWLLYRVAWLKDQGRSAIQESAMLKLHLSEAFVDSSMDAMRIHGGRGYMTDFEVERDLRDAMGGVFYAGTSDIQRNIVAGMLGVA